MRPNLASLARCVALASRPAGRRRTSQLVPVVALVLVLALVLALAVAVAVAVAAAAAAAQVAAQVAALVLAAAVAAEPPPLPALAASSSFRLCVD